MVANISRKIDRLSVAFIVKKPFAVSIWFICTADIIFHLLLVFVKLYLTFIIPTFRDFFKIFEARNYRTM